MPVHTALTRALKLTHPIIQAPMAGGGDTPSLVAAVSAAGGLGFIGAAYLTPEQIAEGARAIRECCSQPFGINLFAPQPLPAVPPDYSAVLQVVSRYHAELGLPAPTPPSPAVSNFDAQLAAALESGAAAFSFTFGLLPPAAVEAIKARGIFLIGTATTVEEAITLEKSAVDAVVAQGAEAGGHRGTFSGDFGRGMVGTMALLPQVVDAIRVPVIASGGIMDGRGIAAALALGASAVQMGTAFLTCREAGIPDAYKDAILHARENDTRITRAFSGRPARGIVNRFMTEVEALPTGSILPFPLQNTLTRPLRSAAVKQGRAEFLNLWAGQGTRMSRKQSAMELVHRLAEETDGVIKMLCGLRSAGS